MTKKAALRFAGFGDEWNEVKLGEVTDIKTGGRDVQDSVEDGLYPFYIRSEEVKRINSYSFDGEAILIPGEGRLGEIFHYANGKFDVHQRVYKISNFTDVNAKFVLQQMKKDFKQHAMRNTVKATVDSLRLPTIQSFTVFVPSLPEQTAIGSFFQDIDQLISLQQRKLEVLKEQKKTYLKLLFPAKGQTKPALRFAGFEDDWKEVKLGEYANYRRGSFPQPYGKKEWYGGEESMPFVQVIDVTDNLALVNDTKQKISKQAQPKSVLVPQGTVIVTLQGSIGRVAITHYDTYVDRTLLIFESYNFPTHIGFWAYTIQNIFEIERQKAPGGTIKTITKEALSSFEISIPSLPEQEAIGSFFQDLDKAIAKQEEKVNQLKESKQTLLRKMFI